METSQKTNINEFDRKYKFDMKTFSDVFLLQVDLIGPETYRDYSIRVRSQLASYYASNCLLRRRSPFTEAHALRLSVRTVQRYWKEFPISDNLLELIYHIQITQL